MPLVFISAYTANLFAILTDVRYEKPLHSIDELPNSTLFGVTFEGTRKIYEKLGNPEIGHVMQMKRLEFSLPKMTNKNNTETITELVSSKLNEGYFLIGYGDFLDVLKRKIDHMYILEGYFSKIGQSFAMKRNWTLAEEVNRKVVFYSLSGYFDRLERKYKVNKSGHKER